MTKILMTPHILGQLEAKHIDKRTRGVLTEKYFLGTLDTSHPCKTGCWTYDKTDDRHIIKVSPLAYDTIATPHLGAGVRKLVNQLFSAVYEHEAAHSKFTTKNLAELNSVLKSKKIPWRLLNLFEDVRIEALAQQQWRTKFNWLRWETYPADVSKVTPTALLYWMKTSPHRSSRWRLVSQAFNRHFNIHPNYRTVYSFLQDIRHARTTEELIPIAERWLATFPRTSDESIEGAGGMGGALGTGDLESAMAERGETVEKVKSGDRGPADDTFKKGESTGTKKAEMCDKDGSGPGLETGAESEAHEGDIPLDASAGQKREFATAARLARMLATAFKGHGKAQSACSRPSKRLNLRSILRKCYDLPYIGPVLARKGRPNISVLFDGSGSMNGAQCYIDRERRHMVKSSEAGRILLMAMSILARRGYITGTAYLCASGGVNFKTTLPFKSALDFKRFYGFSSSEGFGRALRPASARDSRSCFNEVANNKLAICYTDGCITDSPVQRVPLRERGVHTLGICCTMADRTAELKKHFDTPISRESLWGLADALVRFLRSSTF